MHYANDHPVLWNLISNRASFGYTAGNNIVENGDSVVVGQGSFSGPPYAYSPVPYSRVYYTTGIYFSLVCSGEIHGCVLDGLNLHHIMHIRDTGSGTTRLSGIHFKDGRAEGSYGGALTIESALVSLKSCKFSSNQAYMGGAIFARASGTMVNLYTTSFVGNSATNSGEDIYSYDGGASVTVHSTCPPDWSGTPAAGSDLDIANYGTLSGTTKSFDIG